MRQAQFTQPRQSVGSPRASRFATRRRAGRAAPPPNPKVDGPMNLVITLIEAVFATIWFVLTLPFRLVFGLLSLIGRAAGVVVGLAFMVLGAALCAGPFLIIGAPLFLIGLFLTLRCLG